MGIHDFRKSPLSRRHRRQNPKINPGFSKLLPQEEIHLVPKRGSHVQHRLAERWRALGRPVIEELKVVWCAAQNREGAHCIFETVTGEELSRIAEPEGLKTELTGPATKQRRPFHQHFSFHHGDG